jgi:hypothetical protein
MMSVTVLIDKLTEIQRSIGVESDYTIHNQVIDAQDLALQVQAETAEILRIESRRNAARIHDATQIHATARIRYATKVHHASQTAPAVSWKPVPPPFSWRRAFAAILPFAAASPLWKR